MTASSDFWNENLQESIQTASQQGRTLLCFVSDDSERSKLWQDVIEKGIYRQKLSALTVPLYLRKDSQAFGFLTVVCPVQQVPALVLIKGGQIEEKLEDSVVSVEDLERKLAERYSTLREQVNTWPPQVANSTDAELCLEFAPSAGQMRLPNNAYDALRERTEKLQQQKISPKNILLIQLRLMDNIEPLKSYVKETRARPAGAAPVLSEEVIKKLLNTPASALQPGQSTPAASSTSPAADAPSTTPLTPASSEPAAPDSDAPQVSDNEPLVQSRFTAPALPDRSTRETQRAAYIKQQRERQQAQRAERERIKAQIKSDREERRRLDGIRKQAELANLREENSTAPNPSSTDVRIQIRTFSGSTLRTTFTKSATIAEDVRPWIDDESENPNNIPYNLKLMLSPSQNRDIQVEEEGHVLPDLGIVGSATLIMVPVKGFVDSYSDAQPGLVGSVVGGVTGAAGSIIGGVSGVVGSVAGGVLGIMGLRGSATTQQRAANSSTSLTPAAPSGDDETGAASSSSATVKVRTRTLADQRADEAKKRGTQLYNGNSLDFQGRKDDEDRKED